MKPFQTDLFGCLGVPGLPPWRDPARRPAVRVEAQVDRDFVDESREVGRLGVNRTVWAVVVRAGDGSGEVLLGDVRMTEAAAAGLAAELRRAIERGRQMEMVGV